MRFLRFSSQTSSGILFLRTCFQFFLRLHVPDAGLTLTVIVMFTIFRSIQCERKPAKISVVTNEQKENASKSVSKDAAKSNQIKTAEKPEPDVRRSSRVGKGKMKRGLSEFGNEKNGTRSGTEQTD